MNPEEIRSRIVLLFQIAEEPKTLSELCFFAFDLDKMESVANILKEAVDAKYISETTPGTFWPTDKFFTEEMYAIEKQIRVLEQKTRDLRKQQKTPINSLRPR